MLSIETWLAADSGNVVVTHCLAGKGRTGLVIACQLFYHAQCSSIRAALQLFAEQRSQRGKGVRQLGQLRYAAYVETALRAPRLLPRRRLRLRKLTLRHSPAFEQYYSNASATYVLGCAPLVEVYKYCAPSPALDKPKLGHYFKLIYTDCMSGQRPRRNFTILDDAIELPLDVVLDGDVLIKVFHSKERAMFNAGRVEMFHFQFHTMFVDATTNELTLGKAELNEAQNNSKCSRRCVRPVSHGFCQVLAGL